MRYGVLGELRVVVDDGQALVAVGPPKQRALLALLALSAGTPVPAERLVDQLWAGRPPRTAAHSVQVYVSDLRARLRAGGGDPIETWAGGYLLRAGPDDVDALAFEARLDDGRAALVAGRAEQAVRLLSSALDLWRGPALSDFAGEEFAQEPIARLDGLRLDALEELGQALLDVGDPARALRLAEQAVAGGPLRERPRRLLMVALYRLGRHAESLRSFVRYADLLSEDLGVEPSPDLRRLYERVLLHDPALLGAPPTAGDEAPRNPYKGLRAFSAEDAADFFGRDDVVADVLSRLRSGLRLVTLLGPSGSGKSSVLAAGVVPRLGELGGDRRALPVPCDEHGVALLESGLRAGGVLVIDQWEELYLHPDHELVGRFTRALAAALSEGGVCAVAGLRADFYDRPLQHAELARLFLDGALTVLPLSAAELEQAVVRPAAAVGVRIEHGLAAEMVADAVDRPGALPLLQYALTELFERGMTLGAYREIGRLSGALRTRAEQLYAAASPSERSVVEQVLLRLVRVVTGERDSRRSATVRELTAAAVDPLELSQVLHLLAEHRLLTLGRDAVSGESVVELAHESLLWEWDRYAGWVERHRAALADRESLLHAVEEWEASDRHPDYLLRGRRLERFTGPGSDAVLTTARERALLEASLAEREAERARTMTLRRSRTRRRLVAAGSALVLAAGAATGATVLSGGDDRPRVALLFHDAGTEVDQQARSGFDASLRDFDVVGQVHHADAEGAFAEGERAAESADVVLVLTIQTDVELLARRHPDVHFVVTDHVVNLPNVTSVVSRDEEGAYLAGAAAAMTTTTGTVGFVGGVRGHLIGRFQAGFTAGARAVRPDVQVLVDYLSSPPDFDGFVDQPGGEAAARRMYGGGADVIFAAAGQSGLGVFEAAADLTESDGRQRWAIGVDEDQHDTVPFLNGVVDPERWRRHILTSVIKTQDRTVYGLVQDAEDGHVAAGMREVGLADDAVALSWTGGHLEAHRAEIERLRAAILAGDVRVPFVPD